MKAECMFYKLCHFFSKKSYTNLQYQVAKTGFPYASYICIYMCILCIYTFFFFCILPWFIITSDVQTLGWGDSQRKKQDATGADSVGGSPFESGLGLWFWKEISEWERKLKSISKEVSHVVITWMHVSNSSRINSS